MRAYLMTAVVLLASTCWAYPSGAPPNACDSMTPGHGPAAQDSPSPFVVTLDPNVVEPGSTVTVNIKGAPMLRGFLVKAIGSDGATVVGSFSSSGSNYKTLDCSGIQNSAATHTNGDDKPNVALSWIAPVYDGEVTFEVTVVANKSTFWTRTKPAQRLMVKRGASTSGFGPGSFGETTRMPAGVSLPPQASTIYQGCGDFKGCYGPDNCVANKNCQYMTTYRINSNNTVSFELLGKKGGNQYVAVGFSEDAKMGDDSVVQCINWNGVQSAWTSTNVVANNREASSRGVTLISSSNDGNTLYCYLLREPQADKYNLVNGQFHLLLANGPAGGSDGTLTFHGKEDMIASHDKMSLKDVSLQKSAASMRSLIAAHVLLLVSLSLLPRSLLF